jgi:act minimal PKS chain-length factor (CLF/KS beta)
MESAMCPMGLVSQLPLGTLSTVDDPARAYLPFADSASGYVPGEGGAFLVVEDAATARKRGAPAVYGEIAGYAATFDARAGADREPGLARAAVLALQDADVLPDDVDVVFADAAGTLSDDLLEAQVLAKLFGPRGVPVTAPKAGTGRLNSGAGALDVVTALLAIRDGVIPPTVNVESVGHRYEIDLVLGEERRTPVRTALVLARGVGGFNAAVVVRAAQ